MRRLQAVTTTLLAASTSLAGVDLVLVSTAADVPLGGTAAIQLFATASGDDAEPVAALDVIIGWDPAVLTFVGIDNTGGGPFLSATIPAGDIYGLNEADPPADGDALFTALAMFGAPFTADPEGSLVTTLLFEAAAPADDTPIDLIESGGSPVLETRVISGETPGLIITGELIGTTVSVLGPGCTADLDGDGDVDSLDLNILLNDFGCDTGDCAADLDADGATDSIDLNLVLDEFGCAP